ncbi:MAG TPA: DUF302 domain-containing protein [Candidatus Acidoferrum sp.]|nr:DUF302 domain-containing protein [Candidatus Acidoferrum sp.]
MPNRIVKTSRYSYADTIAKLSAAITGGGNTTFATIDQAAAAQGVGLSLRPTTLIVFGNPKGGTGLMAAFPLAALDLPLKVLVWEEQGVVSVAYVPPEEIAARYNVTGMDALIANMSHALDALTNLVV